MNQPNLIELSENEQKATIPIPRLNPSKSSHYFTMITKALKSHYKTCRRSYGLFIEGEPDEILAYLHECYGRYNEWATTQGYTRGFHYFVNTNPALPGIIYYERHSETKEVKQGDVIGYSWRPTAIIGHQPSQ